MALVKQNRRYWQLAFLLAAVSGVPVESAWGQAPPASRQDFAKKKAAAAQAIAGAPAVDPIAADPTRNQAAKPAPVPAKSTEPEKIDSLFYSQEEVRDIHLAVNTYLKHISNRQDLTFDEEAFLRRLSGLKTNAPSRYYTYPQFFLDSLVYHKKDDWIIWLNGQKITQDTLAEGTQIHVLEIDAEKVTIEWLPVAMERVLEVWNQIPNEETTVDQLRGKVIFTLHPNQTFSSYVMKVLEGKVLPVTVDTALIENTLSAADAVKKEEANKPPNPEPAKPASAPRNREGLSGLIESYQNLKQEEAP